MPLPPSRRDVTGPPPRNVSDLSKIVRHHDSYLRQLDPGLQGGRFGTPRPFPHGPSQIVGGEDGGGGADDNHASEWDDRLTVIAAGTQRKFLSHIPDEESLHVRWHPRGYGALPITNEFFTVTDQVVTIPTFDGLAVGDTFSFQYEYLIEENAPEPSVVGVTAPGAWDGTAKKVSFDLPVGTVAGDALILTQRGSVAPGGGELIDSQSCSDPRMQLVYTATSLNSGHVIVESVWVGFADGSGAPIAVDVVNTTNPTAAAPRGVLAAITGVNGFTDISAVESGTATPVIDAIASVAVVWARSSPFGSVTAAAPSSYTDIGSSGADYFSTDVSWWYDPDASTSPAGTFAGEGCCVIGLT